MTKDPMYSDKAEAEPAGQHVGATQPYTWVEQYLERIASDVRERGIRVEIKIIHGSAPVSIAQFAESNRADLVVMATGGRPGISRWMMGSVADRVVRGAIVPVLVVQTRGE